MSTPPLEGRSGDGQLARGVVDRQRTDRLEAFKRQACFRSSEALSVRPGLAQVAPEEAQEDSALRQQFDRLDQAINQWLQEQKVPA